MKCKNTAALRLLRETRATDSIRCKVTEQIQHWHRGAKWGAIGLLWQHGSSWLHIILKWVRGKREKRTWSCSRNGELYRMTAINDKLIMMQLPLQNNFYATIISAFSPTMTNSEESNSAARHSEKSFHQWQFSNRREFNARVRWEVESWQRYLPSLH